MRDTYPGFIRRTAGTRPERFTYQFDPVGGRLRMNFEMAARAGENFDGRYEVGNDGLLRLHGRLGGRDIDIQLVRKH
jgi:hypothetical protein